MTDNEIIKALECCATEDSADCTNCPLNKIEECYFVTLHTYSLDLINRQKAEIERLEKENTVLWENNHILATEYAEEYAVKAKGETIKEFAERLEADLGDIFMVNHPCVSAIIDKLVKEMTEGV